MNKHKLERMLWKLEYQMRKAEAEGDAILVAHYAEMTADLKELSEDVRGPHVHSKARDGV